MNWDRIEGNWKQVVGKARAQWGKLTDDDFNIVAGRREQLAGKIQERYGVAKEDADKQISDMDPQGRRFVVQVRPRGRPTRACSGSAWDLQFGWM